MGGAGNAQEEDEKFIQHFRTKIERERVLERQRYRWEDVIRIDF
jgi:hypothetical protein